MKAHVARKNMGSLSCMGFRMGEYEDPKPSGSMIPCENTQSTCSQISTDKLDHNRKPR